MGDLIESLLFDYTKCMKLILSYREILLSPLLLGTPQNSHSKNHWFRQCENSHMRTNDLTLENRERKTTLLSDQLTNSCFVNSQKQYLWNSRCKPHSHLHKLKQTTVLLGCLFSEYRTGIDFYRRHEPAQSNSLTVHHRGSRARSSCLRFFPCGDHL